MWTLRFAATVAAVVTIILNAHHGFISATTLEYAVMLAALNAALDVAKSALLPAALTAWRRGAYVIALVSLSLFPPLFCNSVWNAVSQVALSRTAASMATMGAIEARDRDLDVRRRKSDELATLEENPIFQASAACALPKTKDARTLCQAVADLNSELAAIDARLTSPTPPDPQPAITWLAELTAKSRATVAFIVAIAPVLLAELVGSLGFVIAAAPKPVIATEPPKRPVGLFCWRTLGVWPRPPENPSAAPAAPRATGSETSSTAQRSATAPNISWSIPQ